MCSGLLNVQYNYVVIVDEDPPVSPWSLVQYSFCLSLSLSLNLRHQFGGRRKYCSFLLTLNT